ncbi:hypothetical protein [Bifidobacterium thermophilum]|uniref:Uncharacterized protein n=1 Tax=Bifidobacterium thermophilum RBL67 TaxID=1254439 RepID=M4RU62_9BIFI|nr:hypothetical protein [Bifidobacterium thermophilum]AGH41992.1 hypothetical protein D805_1725 [Bifidobacterium thermophilum RBL67]MDW8486560.1 hypothetical protein [Bifidobacterium thermophilum]
MKNFFKGISVPQLVAGALAAVTSFLLSARIGIAGSVIGVAVGSIVSAVSSQLYQNILKASSEKLQDVKGGDDEQIEGEQTDQTADADGSNGETASHPRRISSDETTVLPVQGDQSAANARNTQDEGEAKPDATRAMPTVGAADATTVMQPADDATRVISGVSAAAHGHTGADGHQGRVIVSGNETGTTAARHLSGSANTERARKTKRVAIIISVVSALVAVGITAGVIMLVTRGEGTDSVVRDMVGNARVTPTPTPSDSQTQRDDDHQLEKPSDKPSATASPSPSASSSASASSTASPSPSATASASPSASASSSSSSTSGSDSGSSAGSNGGGTSDSGTTDGSDSGTTGTDSDTSGTGSSSSGSTDGSGTATK